MDGDDTGFDFDDLDISQKRLFCEVDWRYIKKRKPAKKQRVEANGQFFNLLKSFITVFTTKKEEKIQNNRKGIRIIHRVHFHYFEKNLAQVQIRWMSITPNDGTLLFNCNYNKTKKGNGEEKREEIIIHIFCEEHFITTKSIDLLNLNEDERGKSIVLNLVKIFQEFQKYRLCEGIKLKSHDFMLKNIRNKKINSEVFQNGKHVGFVSKLPFSSFSVNEKNIPLEHQIFRSISCSKYSRVQVRCSNCQSVHRSLLNQAKEVEKAKMISKMSSSNAIQYSCIKMDPLVDEFNNALQFGQLEKGSDCYNFLLEQSVLLQANSKQEIKWIKYPFTFRSFVNVGEFGGPKALISFLGQQWDGKKFVGNTLIGPTKQATTRFKEILEYPPGLQKLPLIITTYYLTKLKVIKAFGSLLGDELYHKKALNKQKIKKIFIRIGDVNINKFGYFDVVINILKRYKCTLNSLVDKKEITEVDLLLRNISRLLEKERTNLMIASNIIQFLISLDGVFEIDGERVECVLTIPLFFFPVLKLNSDEQHALIFSVFIFIHNFFQSQSELKNKIFLDMLVWDGETSVQGCIQKYGISQKIGRKFLLKIPTIDRKIGFMNDNDHLDKGERNFFFNQYEARKYQKRDNSSSLPCLHFPVKYLKNEVIAYKLCPVKWEIFIELVYRELFNVLKISKLNSKCVHLDKRSKMNQKLCNTIYTSSAVKALIIIFLEVLDKQKYIKSVGKVERNREENYNMEINKNNPKTAKEQFEKNYFNTIGFFTCNSNEREKLFFRLKHNFTRDELIGTIAYIDFTRNYKKMFCSGYRFKSKNDWRLKQIPFYLNFYENWKNLIIQNPKLKLKSNFLPELMIEKRKANLRCLDLKVKQQLSDGFSVDGKSKGTQEKVENVFGLQRNCAGLNNNPTVLNYMKRLPVLHLNYNTQMMLKKSTYSTSLETNEFYFFLFQEELQKLLKVEKENILKKYFSYVEKEVKIFDASSFPFVVERRFDYNVQLDYVLGACFHGVTSKVKKETMNFFHKMIDKLDYSGRRNIIVIKKSVVSFFIPIYNMVMDNVTQQNIVLFTSVFIEIAKTRIVQNFEREFISFFKTLDSFEAEEVIKTHFNTIVSTLVEMYADKYIDDLGKGEQSGSEPFRKTLK